MQSKHMPLLASHGASSSLPALTLDNVGSYPILLPSNLSDSDRHAICSPELILVEEDLRYADAFDALEDVRHALRMRTAYLQDKVANVTGQRTGTRARTMQSSVDEAVRNAAQRYCSSRLALEALRGPGKWQGVLKPLLDSDLVGLSERALSQEEQAEVEHVRSAGEPASGLGVPLTGAVSVGEGRRTLSWIWYSGDTGAAEGGNDWGMCDGALAPASVMCIS